MNSWLKDPDGELLRKRRARERREALLNVSAWLVAWLLRGLILGVVIGVAAFAIAVAVRLASR